MSSTPVMEHNPTPTPSRHDKHPEEGSGTVLTLGIIAAVLILTVLALGVAGAHAANRRAATAADLAALAAADTLRGFNTGEPCEVAAHIARENGAQLVACTFPERIETVDVRVGVPITGPFAFLGSVNGTARAGAPDGGNPDSADE